MNVTILGSGTSIGVPMPTCQCEVCMSKDPHDNRLRCSALIRTDDDKDILVDCGPDFRLQALRAGIKRLDALLLTHNHFDHCYGLDDLRPWAYWTPLPTYADKGMSQSLLTRWDYIFVHQYPGVPKLVLHTVHPSQGDVFKIGETLELRWQAPEKDSQYLFAHADFPYWFGTPFGLSGHFRIRLHY